MNRPTYYDLLEIPPSASAPEIREAYLRTKMAYQKNSVALYSLMSSEGERESVLQQIEEAYAILSDSERRRLYDKNYFSESPPTPSIKPSVRTPTPPLPQPTPLVSTPGGDPLCPWNGDTLKQYRLQSGFSLEEISQSTKISKTYLLALEAEQFDKLPAWVYLRGFLIQMAKLLKLSPDPLLETYSKAWKAFQADRQRSSS